MYFVCFSFPLLLFFRKRKQYKTEIMKQTKKYLILCVVVIMHFYAYAQKSISLEKCYKIAEMKSDSTSTRTKIKFINKSPGIQFFSLGKYYKIAEMKPDSTSIRNNNQSIRERHGIIFSEPRKFKLYILIKKYPTFQSKSIPLTNLNGTTSFITNDKYVYKTGDYN